MICSFTAALSEKRKRFASFHVKSNGSET